MQAIRWGRATSLGLALLLLGLLFRVTWHGHHAASVSAELGDAARWLRGHVVVVDPGHGGDDPGGVVRGTLEKDVVLQIGLVLQQVLQERGATVVMTRDRDTNLGGPLREELRRRVAVAERHRPAVLVSIHANKDGCYCWGAQTFFQQGGMPAGKFLALAIQERMRKLTPTTRAALPADYFVLRTSPVPAAMIEVGFLTNEKEHRKLKEPAYQRTLAVAVALGIADFLRGQAPQAEAGGSIGR